MFSDEDDVDDPEVLEEDNDDEDDLNYFEPDYFDYPDDKYETFTDLMQVNNSTEMLSLQDICLMSISQNLPRFNVAFTTTEDSDFQRNLRFLQRVHSSYLIKAATKYSKKLNESYFDFLLNQYIKEFDMDVLYKCDWDTVIKRISEIGHGFQKVRFNFPERSEIQKNVDFVNKIVCHLPNVEILDLKPYCNDSTLKVVATSCQQLKELYIDKCCAVTDKGLKSLCQENDGKVSCLNLKHLSVSDIDGVNDGIAYLLQNMATLEAIVHHDLPHILYKMHKDSMNNTLDRKYNLTSLYLGVNSPWENTSTTIDILTLFTDVCPHIKILSLPLISKELLDLCFKFQELEEFLAHNFNSNQNLDLNEFLKSKGGILRRLKLEKCTLSAAILIQNCPKLESLNLQDIKFQSSEPGTILQPLNNLQELSLEFFSLGDTLIPHAVIEILNSSQTIEKLTLLNVKFETNEEFVTRLSKFCENESLKYLTFTGCDVEDAFLQSVLFTCSNLKVLTVESCDNITATHVDNLYEIASSLKRKVKINWHEDGSEFNSIESGDDIFDDYSGFDSDYDNQDDYDPYDSDNIYYGYDDIDDY